MSNPTITNSDPNKLVLFNGVYRPETVTVGANETLAVGTILSYNTSTGKTVVFAIGGSNGTNVPQCLLMEELVNATGSAVDYANVQVLVAGEVDAALVVVDGTSYTPDTVITSGVPIRVALRSVGIITTASQVTDVLDNQ